MEDVSVADKKHPVTDLLDDIVSACRQLDGRRELQEQVKALIRAKQNAVLAATSDHWQKKYDQEQKQKSDLAAKYRSLKEAFDLLATRAQTDPQPRPAPSLVALPQVSPSKAKDRSRSFVSSSFKQSAPQSTFKLSIEQPTDFEASRRWDSARKPGLGPSMACPLCQQQLHPVFAELREAEQRAETLSDILASMGRKGRELMGVNAHLGSKLAQQQQESAGLLETLKALLLQREPDRGGLGAVGVLARLPPSGSALRLIERRIGLLSRDAVRLAR